MTTEMKLQEAYDDFILSRKSISCSPATLSFYRYTAYKFISWLQAKDIDQPQLVKAKNVREFLSKLIDEKKSAWTVHDNARAIRTMLSFWHAEEYIPRLISFENPPLPKNRIPSPTKNEIPLLLEACFTLRDKVIILFLADSGIRRGEAIKLNWSNINLKNGLVFIKDGKGGKDRTTVVGKLTLSALEMYKKSLGPIEGSEPLFQTDQRTRFTAGGFLLIFTRISKRTKIKVYPHALRRSFARFSLRSGMNPLHLQAMLGHATLEMVKYYIGEIDDDDLLMAHEQHGPIDDLGDVVDLDDLKKPGDEDKKSEDKKKRATGGKNQKGNPTAEN